MSEKIPSGVDGDPAYCRDCTAPIVLYHTGESYTLTCSCSNRGVAIDEVTTETNLFEPVTGGWSQIDEADVQTNYE